MLDICCGDSFILNHISEYIDDYLGVDNNDKYLKQCKHRWKKFNFMHLDLNDTANIDHFIKFKPNFIFHLAAQSLVGLSYKNPELTWRIIFFEH